MTQQTLPEQLVAAIKQVVEAHRNYCRVVEEMQALGSSMQGDLDRLVSRQGEKLGDISLVGKAPVPLPRAIVPLPKEADGAA
jgi:hypothetical protein